MKKVLLTLMLTLVGIAAFQAQTENNKPDNSKKVRFGLRITPQPTWFSSADKNSIPARAKFGFGFGLNLEYQISDVASFLTGIGGDFEGGTYKFRYQPGVYEASYWLNDVGDYISPRQDRKKGSYVYIINQRKVSSTFVTLPALLKLFTSEYNGTRFFGLFGGELGIRVALHSDDTYYEERQYTSDSTFVVKDNGQVNTDLNIGEEGSFPIRLGMHAGIGMEYRLGGTTTAFCSLSYFRSFVNTFAGTSDFLTYRTDRDAGKETYQMVKQNLKLNALRITLGIMF